MYDMMHESMILSIGSIDEWTEEISCMSTPLHSNVTCVWDDIPIGFGT